MSRMFDGEKNGTDMSRRLWLTGFVLAIGAAAMFLHYRYSTPVDEYLGLSRRDLALGGISDIDILYRKTTAVSQAYLREIREELEQYFGGPYELTESIENVKRIRSLGYESCFYYYCWSVFLPYSLTTSAGAEYLVIVQLDDSTGNYNHCIDKFRVLRVLVLDKDGKTVLSYEELSHGRDRMEFNPPLPPDVGM